MKSTSFPGCCTARVLRDFGGTSLALDRKAGRTKVSIKRWLESQIKNWAGHSCLIVTTNSEQTTANKVLKELGFKHSAWMSKLQHPEAKLRLWWKEP